MTTKKYLNNIFKPQKGHFVEKNSGKILGQHEGFWQYTIGQRKGIGIAAPYPLYVIDIDAKTNTVFVGYQEELFQKELILEKIDWHQTPPTEFRANVKIRYNMQACPSTIKKVEKAWQIIFDEPISAITKGQACVLYDINDGHLLGGCFI